MAVLGQLHARILPRCRRTRLGSETQPALPPRGERAARGRNPRRACCRPSPHEPADHRLRRRPQPRPRPDRRAVARRRGAPPARRGWTAPASSRSADRSPGSCPSRAGRWSPATSAPPAQPSPADVRGRTARRPALTPCRRVGELAPTAGALFAGPAVAKESTYPVRRVRARLLAFRAASAAGELRRPLGQERLDGLAVVGRLPQLGLQPALEGERVLQGVRGRRRQHRLHRAVGRGRARPPAGPRAPAPPAAPARARPRGGPGPTPPPSRRGRARAAAGARWPATAPTQCTRRAARAESLDRPIPVNAVVNFAPAAATRRSPARAMPSPAPAQAPLTPTTTGTRSAARARISGLYSSSTTDSDVAAFPRSDSTCSARSWPTQNARPDAGQQHRAHGLVRGHAPDGVEQVPAQRGGEPRPLEGEGGDPAGVVPGHGVGHRRPASRRSAAARSGHGGDGRPVRGEPPWSTRPRCRGHALP